MFNLEQSIAEWRQQMLAAGIKTPVPLDELETHLREEIARSLQSGMDGKGAYEAAVVELGHGSNLKDEFHKAGDPTGRMMINRALGLLWLVYCLGSFYQTTSGLLSVFPSTQITPLFVLAWLLDFIYLRGVIASVRLFSGFERERRFILLLAILDALGGVAFLLTKTFQPLSFTFTVLGFVSIWLLWPRQDKKIATA